MQFYSVKVLWVCLCYYNALRPRRELQMLHEIFLHCIEGNEEVLQFLNLQTVYFLKRRCSHPPVIAQKFECLDNRSDFAVG